MDEQNESQQASFCNPGPLHTISTLHTLYQPYLFHGSQLLYMLCTRGVGRDPKDVLRVKKEGITNNVVAKMLKMFTFCPDKV